MHQRRAAHVARDAECVSSTAASSHDTKLIGIVGNPLGHSLSPDIHNQRLRASNLDFVVSEISDAGCQRTFSKMPVRSECRRLLRHDSA